MLSFLEKPRVLFYLLLFLVFGVYLSTVSRTVSFGDAGDFITAAFEMGVPHPPGYPLHTILGKIFTVLIPIGEIAFRVNLVSSFFGLLTILLIYAIIYKLTKSPLAAFLGGSFLAFSSGFWTYSIVTDVFALNAFFAAALIWIILCWREKFLLGTSDQKTATRNYFLLFCFVYGLALTNHLTIVFLAPAFVFLVLATLRSHLLRKAPLSGAVYPPILNRGAGATLSEFKVVIQGLFRIIPPKIIGLGLILFFIGLLPYLYLVPAAQHNPLVNWDNPRTWYNAQELSGLKRILTRADYGTGRWTSTTASVLPSGRPAVYQLLFFSEMTFYQFAGLGVVLLLCGIVVLAKKRNWIDLTFLLTIFLIPSAGFMIYTNLSYTDSAALSALERFLIMPYLGAAIFIGRGVSWLSDFIKEKRPRFDYRLLIILGFFPIIFHYVNVDQSKNYLFYDYGRLMFDSTREVVIKKDDKVVAQPTKALLITKGDLMHFMSDYIEGVQNKYPKVYVLNMEMLTYPWYVAQAKIRYPDLNIPFKSMDGKTGFFFDLVASNIDNFRVYIPQMKYPGLEPTFAFLPVGTNFWVVRDSWKQFIDREDFIKVNQDIFSADLVGQTLNKKVPVFKFAYPWTWWAREVALNYSVFKSNLGTTFQQNGWNELAIPQFEEALRIAPQLVEFETHFNLGVAYQAVSRFDDSLKEYGEAQKLNPNFADLYKNIGIVYQNGLKDKEKAILAYEKFVQLSTDEKEKAKVQTEIEKLRL